MDTNSVWSLLSEIPIGTIVAWVIVIATIVGVFCTGAIKLYKLFTKYREMKDESNELKETVQRLDGQFGNIVEKLDKVIEKLDEQDAQSRIELRHSIVRAGEEALINGSITIRQFKALHEMYSTYHKPDKNGKVGNGYVTTLMEKVDKLPIVGRLNENDEDI